MVRSHMVDRNLNMTNGAARDYGQSIQEINPNTEEKHQQRDFLIQMRSDFEKDTFDILKEKEEYRLKERPTDVGQP